MAGMRILILCTGNSCRSQMAEGFFRHLAGDHALICSAGIESHGLNPNAVATMKEIGIDISGQYSKTADELETTEFDYIITVCDHAYEHCPYFPGNARRIHKDFPDPAKATGDEAAVKDAFRDTRDRIHSFVQDFFQHHASVT